MVVAQDSQMMKAGAGPLEGLSSAASIMLLPSHSVGREASHQASQDSRREEETLPMDERSGKYPFARRPTPMSQPLIFSVPTD